MSDTATAHPATWNAEPFPRQPPLDAPWSSLVVHPAPLSAAPGRAAPARPISALPPQYPDFVSTPASVADAPHRQLRFTWGLGPAGEAPAIIGFAVVVLDEHDRIRDVRGF